MGSIELVGTKLGATLLVGPALLEGALELLLGGALLLEDSSCWLALGALLEDAATSFGRAVGTGMLGSVGVGAALGEGLAK